MMTDKVNIGCIVIRGNPLHLGHQRTIDQMIADHGMENSVLFVGSANVELSLRNLFSYKERRDFIKRIYPELKVLPIADQKDDVDWFESLIDMIEAVFPFPHLINLYCGDLMDIANFPYDDKIAIKVIDRYEEQVISATEVRTWIVADNFKGVRELVDGRISFDVFARGRARIMAMLHGRK